MALTVAILACTWSGLTHSELRPNYIDCIPSRVKEKLLSRSSRSRPSPRWRGPWPAILRPEARCEREEVSGSEAAQRSGNVHPPDVPDRSAGADLPPQLHIRAMRWQLQQCARGNIKRLLITLPPRNLKSICASVAFPAWMRVRCDLKHKFIALGPDREKSIGGSLK
jgi:hypothetical protein